MKPSHDDPTPARLLLDFQHLLTDTLPGPVLDLACGRGKNGAFVAKKGLRVFGVDKSHGALLDSRQRAARETVDFEVWQADLEKEGSNTIRENAYGAVLVFRYLYRPLIPHIKRALRPGGLLVYETFTWRQAHFGKPSNPDYLLKAGELLAFFEDWQLIHYFEGTGHDPPRATAQLICQKSPSPVHFG